MSVQRNKNILVVDDNENNLKILCDTLAKHAYTVRPAINGNIALAAIAKEPPDLILLDIMMPNLDGYEVCRRLKTNESTRDIPVIFMTGLTETEHKLNGFEAGAVDYIGKPLDHQEVLARVRTHLKLRTLQYQLTEEKDRFRALTEAALEGILIHEEGRIVDVNPAFETLSGYTRQELIGQNVFTLLPQEFRPLAEEQMHQVVQSSYEVMGRHKDGHDVPLEIHGRTVTTQEYTLRVLAVRDISWRKTIATLQQQTRQLEAENLSLKATLHDRDHVGELWGRSAIMQKVYEYIIQAAASDEAVILYGETGTGKELAAKTIFQLSNHHTKTFVVVNCGAIPEHLFESQFFGYRKGAFTDAHQDTPGYFDRAQGGTLFLDEIGELPLAMQIKFLRVLEDGSYTRVGETRTRTADVRIVTATNRELRDMVKAGDMREDFFYRLHVLPLELPPLRHRKEDLPLLIRHFLTDYPNTDITRLPDDISARFLDYDWPGNVRELFNELRRYVATGTVELRGELPADNAPASTWQLTKGLDFAEQVDALEQHLIADALTHTGGNKTRTAALLNLPIMSLRRKMKKYGLG